MTTNMILNNPILLIAHPFWSDPFFYMFSVLLIVGFLIIKHIMRLLKNKNIEIKQIQQQHLAKVDQLRKDQSNEMSLIRREVALHENERHQQFLESEKETLQVLSGISTLLDITDKVSKIESEKILDKLEEIELKIKKIIPIE